MTSAAVAVASFRTAFFWPLASDVEQPPMQDDVGKLVQEQMARSPTADDGFRRVVRTGTLHDVSSANETFHEAIDEAGRNPVAAERPAEKNGDAPLG